MRKIFSAVIATLAAMSFTAVAFAADVGKPVAPDNLAASSDSVSEAQKDEKKAKVKADEKKAKSKTEADAKKAKAKTKAEAKEAKAKAKAEAKAAEEKAEADAKAAKGK